MPIVTIEIVGRREDGATETWRLANALGEAMNEEPGRVWVRVRWLHPDDYNENGGTDLEPVFVNVLRADRPDDDEARAITTTVAKVLGRRVENVHVIYEPSARGRVWFGGKPVERAPTRVRSGAPWEEVVGYSRVVIDRGHVYVTGTAPVNEDGTTHAPDDAYAQAKRCLELIDKTLSRMNVGRDAIVRTRMFVTDIARWEEFGRAHAEFFDGDGPATTMVEVSRLIDPDMLIEIEADARI